MTEKSLEEEVMELEFVILNTNVTTRHLHILKRLIADWRKRGEIAKAYRDLASAYRLNSNKRANKALDKLAELSK